MTKMLDAHFRSGSLDGAARHWLVRHRAVSAAKPLDSFPASAQDRSCTNKITGCVPLREFPRSPTCGGFAAQRSALRRLVSSLMLTDTTAVTAAGSADKI